MSLPSQGYSGTPLIRKMGFKPGMRLVILNPPQGYDATLGPLPEGVQQFKRLGKAMNLIHFFTQSAGELAGSLPKLKQALGFDGALWVSWPKQASGVVTDLNENIVRQLGLGVGLVDVKVIAVDEVWSGLKFVYRLKDRPMANHERR